MEKDLSGQTRIEWHDVVCWCQYDTEDIIVSAIARLP